MTLSLLYEFYVTLLRNYDVNIRLVWGKKPQMSFEGMNRLARRHGNKFIDSKGINGFGRWYGNKLIDLRHKFVHSVIRNLKIIVWVESIGLTNSIGLYRRNQSGVASPWWPNICLKDEMLLLKGGCIFLMPYGVYKRYSLCGVDFETWRPTSEEGINPLWRCHGNKILFLKGGGFFPRS